MSNLNILYGETTNFKQLTDIIRKRVPMWIGSYNIDDLYLFLSGWTLYELLNNVDDDFGLAFKKYFSWWLHKKIRDENYKLHKEKCNISQNYTHIIKVLAGDSKEQISIFFKLLDNFYNDFSSGVDLSKIESELH